MNVQLLCLMDLVSDTLKQHGRNVFLRNMGFRGDEQSSSCVHSVGSPLFRVGDFEEDRQVGHRGKDLERFGKGSGLVAG